MFDIGFLELVIVAVIGLLVLGPERLPHAARAAGKWVGKARRMVNQFSREIDRQIEADEIREELRKSGQSLNIEEDVRNIQSTVQSALNEAESNTIGQVKAGALDQAQEFEPLPRQEPDKAFDAEPAAPVLNESKGSSDKNKTA